MYEKNRADSVDIPMMLDPRSGHVDPPVDLGLKKIGYDNITVFFFDSFLLVLSCATCGPTCRGWHRR